MATGALAFASGIYSTSESHAKYQDIQQFLNHDDYDDRCEDNSYQNINYCECEQSFPRTTSRNDTKILRFQGKVDYIFIERRVVIKRWWNKMREEQRHTQTCRNPTNLQTWFEGRFWLKNEEGLVCQCSDTLQPGKWESIDESFP